MKGALQNLGRHAVSLGSFVWDNIKTTFVLILWLMPFSKSTRRPKPAKGTGRAKVINSAKGTKSAKTAKPVQAKNSARVSNAHSPKSSQQK